MSNLKHKLWYSIFFLPVMIFILFPALRIFIVDPLWQWNHPFHLGGLHPGFNERLQKTNYLASHTPIIDILIIGSSRSAYIAPSLLNAKHGFNYSVSSGSPKEFAEYMDFARSVSSTPVKEILLELSFFQSLKNEHKTDELLTPPQEYIFDSQNLLFRFHTLFSRDSYSRCKDVMPVTNSKISHPSYNSYLYDNNSLQSFRCVEKYYATAEAKRGEIDDQANRFYETINKQYYDNNYATYLARVHKSTGQSKCLVYIPPVTNKYLAQITRSSQMGNYIRFLKESVNEFGSVWNFAYPNELTANENNFQDAHHPTLAFTHRLMNIIQHPSKEDKLKYLITKENINQHIKYILKQFIMLYNLRKINDGGGRAGAA